MDIYENQRKSNGIIENSWKSKIFERHIGLVHENKTPLECMLCYAVFIDPKRLKQHKINVHKGKIFVIIFDVIEIWQKWKICQC